MSFNLLGSLKRTAKFLPAFVRKNGLTYSRCRSALRNKNNLRYFTKSSDGIVNDKRDEDKPKRLHRTDGKSRIKKLLNFSSPVKTDLITNNACLTTAYQESPEIKVVENPPPSNVNVDLSSIIMFPGQGNQFVGMTNNLMEYSSVRDMFASASDILGYDLLRLCQKGPEAKLQSTVYCQPAMLVCSLAALEKLKEEKPWAINNCQATCGFSLGELPALVFAGCISFERALKLTRIRAEAMHQCCEKVESGMMTTFYRSNAGLTIAMEAAMNHCKSLGINHPVCCVAIYLCPGCKVIAGHIEALEFLKKNSKKYGLAKLSMLPVSGAFHTSLMKEASYIFKRALFKVDVKEPLIKVYSNVTGLPYKNANEIKNTLPTQIYAPVKWEQTIHSAYDSYTESGKYPFTYECGPGQSLSYLMKKINSKASEHCYAIQL